MLSKKSQYVLKFLARARHRNSIEKTDNAMYALFGFMNDKVYRIFQRLRRKILFIIRLQLMIRRNHEQKELLKLAEAKRERASKSAKFSFFRLIKFRKLPRGWRLFFNLGGYKGIITIARAMKSECHKIAVSLAHDAVAFSEFRGRHALLINELKSLFIDTMTFIITEHSANITDTVGVSAIEHSANISDTVGISAIESQSNLLLSSPSSSSESLTYAVNLRVSDYQDLKLVASAIYIIDSFIRRLLVTSVQSRLQFSATGTYQLELDNQTTTLSSENTSYLDINEHHHEEHVHIFNSELRSSYIIEEHNFADLSDDARQIDSFSSHSSAADELQETIAHTAKSIDEDSQIWTGSRHSQHIQIPANTLPSVDSGLNLTNFDPQVFEDLFLFTTADDLDCQDIKKLMSDMIDCVCNFWIDIAPTQTPSLPHDGGKKQDATYSFQYNLPIATPWAYHQALKTCSWGFYMCVTFYTRIDLVRITAVRSGHELPLLSLSWIDFSSICLPCDSGVRVCLRFQGIFSSLIICQSRFNEIMKIRQCHAARTLASLAHESRVRDCNAFLASRRIERCRGNSYQDFTAKDTGSKMDTMRSKPFVSHHCNKPFIQAKPFTNLSHMKAKGCFSNTTMPFLNLVKLLQSAISMYRAEKHLESTLKHSEQPFSESNLLTSSPLLSLIPEPPKHENTVPSARHIRSQPVTRPIATKLPSRPHISCFIPKVRDLSFSTDQEAPCSLPFVAHESIDSAKSFKVTTKVELCDISEPPGDNFNTSRLLDSRGSLSFRLPTSETKSDSASMMIMFTPQPPSVLHSKLPSPRFIVQKQLASEIPLTAQSPRHYVPHKLVARGRFRSSSAVHHPKQQQHTSQVTILLRDAPLANPPNEGYTDMINTTDSHGRLFNTPRKSTRSMFDSG